MKFVSVFIITLIALTSCQSSFDKKVEREIKKREDARSRSKADEMFKDLDKELK
jgi:hypothetical protein